MKHLPLLLLLLAGSALAQADYTPAHSEEAGTYTPTAADHAGQDMEAASLRVTGPNGVKTAPQASPAALGACAALAGTYNAATPDGETGTRPYFCEGITWRRVHTTADGATLNGDTIAALKALVLTAPEGFTAMAILNGQLDLGPGANDYIYSNGSQVVLPSIVVADMLIQTISPQGSANLQVVLPRWMRVFANGTNPTTQCTSTDAGGFRVYSADGNRPWFCDGTTALPLARFGSGSASIDLPSIDAGSVSSAQAVSVTGAAAGDRMNCQAAGDLGGALDVVQPWATTNTGNFYVRNFSGSAVDAAAVTFNCWVVR